MTDIRNNSLICDCFMYPIAKSARESYFIYTESDLLQIYCHSPPQFHGKRMLYDVRLTDFVCNVTDFCPLGCLCQERPDFGVIHVDCQNASLTSIPTKLPQNKDYSAYELIVSNNKITRIDDVDYANQLSLLRAENNSISEISAEFLDKMADKNPVLNLQNNRLTRVPRTMENIKYQNVSLEGNNLVCDCDMLWMKEWISLAPKYVDKNLECTFEGAAHKIIDLDEDMMDCRTADNIILIVFLSIGLVIVISLIITAKRCPYATKVLIFKIFRIHPADRYTVDTYTDKEYDAYIAYDEDDIYVRQWVKQVLVKQLEETKPRYKLFIGARDMKAGAEAENRCEAMETSRRLVIILSQNFHKKDWCTFDAFQAETLEQNKGRVIFILLDKDGEELAKTEPWLSKTKDRKVFHLKERLFWSKMRYEMPRTPVKHANKEKVQREPAKTYEMTEIAVLS